MWEEDLLFTPVIDSRSELKVSPLINNEYWVAMWEDERVLEYDDTDVDWTEMPNRLYMQRINVDGTLGVPTALDLVNDDLDILVDGTTIIAPKGSEIYTINGVKVRCNNLQSGVYIVVCGDKAQKVLVK